MTMTAQADLMKGMAETQRALDLFLNNKFGEAKAITEPFASSSIYHSLGYCGILYLQAVMTFEANDIDAAIAATKHCLELCQLHRRHTSLTSSLSSSLSKAMQRTTGFGSLGAGAERQSAQAHAQKKEYSQLTDLEIHAELVYAECLLLRSFLTFIQDENLVSFIKGALKIRSCYQSYKECLRIFRHRVWNAETEGAAEAASNESLSKMHFDSGVKMGVGSFNLMISLLPARIMKLLEFAGFSGNKSWGLKQLEEGFLMESSLRSSLCATILLAYHTLISYVVGDGDGDLDFASSVLEKVMKKYPQGALFLFFSGRLEEMRGNLDAAIENFEASIDSQSHWQQFHHICFWELMWCFSFKGDWLLAMKYAEKLGQESRWSPATYAYHKASFLIMVESELPSATRGHDHVAALMRAVPTMTQRIAGKSLPFEKFAVRKVKRFQAQGNRLILPGYELIYVWNGFSILGSRPELLIRPVLSRVEATMASLNLDSESYVEDKCLCLLLGGLCHKYLGNFGESETRYQEILQNHKKLKNEMVYLLPYATAELGFLYFQFEIFEQARAFLERARDHYKGYSLESRLHFRIHSALRKIGHILDGATSPDVGSEGGEVSPNDFDSDQFTFPVYNGDDLDAVASSTSSLQSRRKSAPGGALCSLGVAASKGTNAKLVDEGDLPNDSGIALATPSKSETRKVSSSPSRSSTSSVRSACSECSSENDKVNEWHDCV